MAILSKKKSSESEEVTVEPEQTTGQVLGNFRRLGLLIAPRVSEKSSTLTGMNKFVFKVHSKANKIEIKKTLEDFYGIKIKDINMVKLPGKVRRYGRNSGKMTDFKKAIVTLAKDSKKPSFIAE